MLTIRSEHKHEFCGWLCRWMRNRKLNKARAAARERIAARRLFREQIRAELEARHG